MRAPSIEVGADKTERLFVWLPWSGSASAGYAKLRELLQVERLVVDYDPKARAFRVARSHLVTLAINMADEYGHVTVAQEFKQQAKCTASCQNASPNSTDQCSCVCEGMQHAGGGWVGYWTEVGRELLIGPSNVVRIVRTLDRAAARAWRRGLLG